jgi:hypothetical protein
VTVCQREHVELPVARRLAPVSVKTIRMSSGARIAGARASGANMLEATCNHGIRHRRQQKSQIGPGLEDRVEQIGRAHERREEQQPTQRREPFAPEMVTPGQRQASGAASSQGPCVSISHVV